MCLEDKMNFEGLVEKFTALAFLVVLVWAIVEFAQKASQYAQAHGFVGR